MIGGDKVTLATNAILSRLITDILATKYSWQGRKGKKAFVKLLTAKLIKSKYFINNNNKCYFITHRMVIKGY